GAPPRIAPCCSRTPTWTRSPSSGRSCAGGSADRFLQFQPVESDVKKSTRPGTSFCFLRYLCATGELVHGSTRLHTGWFRRLHMNRLEEFAPAYQFHEVHRIRIRAPRPSIYRSIKEV